MSKSKKPSKQRSAVNTSETSTMSINEKILKECHDLYVDEEKGLIILGEEVGLSLLAPRKKITILLIGNHSAGKSSFINWYVEEHVQKTAVAIETQGFALITSGKRRESLTGNATLHLFPQFRELDNVDGVVDYLSTEVATSKQKKFSFVTFIDTPGLVDGGMKYPFDVEQSMIWFGLRADLILVFFDPLGQALCKRTLDIVESLNNQHPDRIRFYLSKADTAGTQGDRQRVLMQITQELCKRPGLNKTGFDMPTIYIPTLTDKHVQCENHLDVLCEDIDKTINRNIQNTLNTLEKNADEISLRLRENMENDQKISEANSWARCRAYLLYSLGVSLPVIFSIGTASNVGFPRNKKTIQPLLIMFGIVLIISIILVYIARRIHRIQPTSSRKERNEMKEKMDYVEEHVKSRKSILYQEYLRQSVGAFDMS